MTLINSMFVYICFHLVKPTCLLSAPPGGLAARPIPGGVKRGHADHIGGEACQVLQLHAPFRHEEGSQALCLVLPLELPEVNLHQGEQARQGEK